MKKSIILSTVFLLSISLFSSFTYSQSTTLEAGFTGGVTTYSGEITSNNQMISPGVLHPAGGAFLRLNLNSRTAIKCSFIQGAISGDDANSNNPKHVNRNLNFTSVIQEAGLTFEYNILRMSGRKSSFFSPYVYGGIALFHFNPRTQYEGQWVDLQPLGTEGQGSSAYPDRKPYALTQVSFPIGVGVKIALSPSFTLGAEAGLRYTLTDYLDDVSTTYPVELYTEGNSNFNAQLSNKLITPKEFEPGKSYARGNPETKDWYYFTGISLSYHFGSKNSGNYALKNTNIKCYSF